MIYYTAQELVNLILNPSTRDSFNAFDYYYANTHLYTQDEQDMIYHHLIEVQKTISDKSYYDFYSKKLGTR